MTTWTLNVDKETARIRPGLQAPPPVTLQWKMEGGEAQFIHCHRDPDDAEAWWRWALANEDLLITGHNISYDMCVAMARWPELAKPIFTAYAEDRILCTLARGKLQSIADGKRRIHQFNMAAVAKRLKLSEIPDKADPWRLRYWELRDTPIAEFPEAAHKYMKMDVDVGLEIALKQLTLPDQFRQTRADLWLKLATCWGMVADPVQVERFYQQTYAELIEERAMLQEAGLVRSNGKKYVKAAKDRYLVVTSAMGLRPRVTDTGKKKIKSKDMTRKEAIAEGLVSVGKDAVKETGDPLLGAYAKYSSHGTILSRIKRMKHGVRTPLQPSFDSLIDTGRTSCRQGDVKPGDEVMAWGVQAQNVHRAKGLRECFVARKGSVFIASDYSGCELHSVSQVNILMHRDLGVPVDRVKMATALNEGQDVHLWFASKLMGVTYAEALRRKKAGDPEIKEKRQVAKAADFGFPGGLGAVAFIVYAKGYGVDLTDDEARELKALWLRSFPEFELYFKWIRSQLRTVGKDDEGKDIKRLDVTHPYSKRERGQIPFTVACNGFFQGLAADMIKDAGFRISMECYADPSSPLYGYRIVNFIHDEIVLEGPREGCHAAAVRMKEIMEEAGRVWCPDVPVLTDVSLMYRWTKDVPDNTIHPNTGLYVPNEELPGYKGMAIAA